MRELVASTSIIAKQNSYSSGTMDIDGITLNMSKSMVPNTKGSSPHHHRYRAILSYLCANRPAVHIGGLNIVVVGIATVVLAFVRTARWSPKSKTLIIRIDMPAAPRDGQRCRRADRDGRNG